MSERADWDSGGESGQLLKMSLWPGLRIIYIMKLPILMLFGKRLSAEVRALATFMLDR